MNDLNDLNGDADDTDADDAVDPVTGDKRKQYASSDNLNCVWCGLKQMFLDETLERRPG
ncbi:hypothetical protein B0H17DRAFT_1202491 [Mycena rosella]|uniref:Uncharacterized protein n=1 Tax=Mycena rosella TaxID=1033263 RepID=A0AAD7DE62_MYCRO|nr:hypothetical protein B0H17DRAFT_1202491 [Mycena rosella]